MSCCFAILSNWLIPGSPRAKRFFNLVPGPVYWYPGQWNSIPSYPTFFAHPTCQLVGAIYTWSRHQHVSFWCSFGFKRFPQLFGCSFSILFGSLTNCPFKVKFSLFRCGFPFYGSITLAYEFLDFRLLYRFICLLTTYTKAGFYVNTKTETLLELSREINCLFNEITFIKISTNFSWFLPCVWRNTYSIRCLPTQHNCKQKYCCQFLKFVGSGCFNCKRSSCTRLTQITGKKH